MLRRFLHGRLWLSRRAALARGAEPRVLQSRPQERASQQPHPRAVPARGRVGRRVATREAKTCRTGTSDADGEENGAFHEVESAVYLPRSAQESEKTLRKCVSVVSVLLPSLTLTLITCPTRCSAPEG